MSSNNMYRVGDFVYFESSAGVPYQIRKIEELNKTTTGAVEAKVMCYHRRRDDPVHELLPSLSNMNFCRNDADLDEDYGFDRATVGERPLHMLKHRELFPTRQLETLPATHIRGKAIVMHMRDNEDLLGILSNENCFFYKYVYDHMQKILHTGNNMIRRGPQYQAQLPETLTEIPADEYYKKCKRETLKWSAEKCSLSDNQVNNLLLISRSLTVYARAFDPTSIVRQPSLLDATVVASRDHYTLHCLDLLHKCDYNQGKTIENLTPQNGPTLIKDEMESWSAKEAKLLEDGMLKHGKVFHLIAQDVLPWKTSQQIVEFYYAWKTSNYFVSSKRIRKTELEHKLKQVYIPNYTKPNPAVLYNESISDASQTNPSASNSGATPSQPGCESCGNTSSEQWFVWGTLNCPCKLCDCCWSYWKRYGGLKNPNTQDKQQAREMDLKGSTGGVTSSLPLTLNANGLQSGNNASGDCQDGAGSNNMPSYTSKHLHTITTANTHQYQCPQIGCTKLLRQAQQMHAHVVAAHPDLVPVLGDDDQLLQIMEEFRNQKIGFMMMSSPELRAARKIMRSRLNENMRLSRCFKNRESRVRVALNTVTRYQLRNIFNKLIKTSDEDTLKKIQSLIAENKPYKQGLELLNKSIERIKTKKTAAMNGAAQDTQDVKMNEENGV